MKPVQEWHRKAARMIGMVTLRSTDAVGIKSDGGVFKGKVDCGPTDEQIAQLIADADPNNYADSSPDAGEAERVWAYLDTMPRDRYCDPAEDVIAITKPELTAALDASRKARK